MSIQYWENLWLTISYWKDWHYGKREHLVKVIYGLIISFSENLMSKYNKTFKMQYVHTHANFFNTYKGRPTKTRIYL